MHIGNDTDMGVVLYDLEPFTKYAVYVQAYSTALSKTSHTSPIVYFLTEPTGMCSRFFCISTVNWVRLRHTLLCFYSPVWALGCKNQYPGRMSYNAFRTGFSFFSDMWMAGKKSRKWSFLCQVGHKTLINLCFYIKIGSFHFLIRIYDMTKLTFVFGGV